MKDNNYILSLKKITALRGISKNRKELIIKSMSTINDVFYSPHVTDNLAILRHVCRNIATNPLRNMATVGGNIASRYTWTELGAVLIALEAQLQFVGSDNKKERCLVENFFSHHAKTDKILESIIIKHNKAWSFTYRRIPKLSNVDIPLLAICLGATFRDHHFDDDRPLPSHFRSFNVSGSDMRFQLFQRNLFHSQR